MWPDFGKINHFVTFDTLNISSSNKALHSTNQLFSEHRISLCNELLEILWNILRTVCVLLWQQCKVLGSIYFTSDKVVDFPKSGHISRHSYPKISVQQLTHHTCASIFIYSYLVHFIPLALTTTFLTITTVSYKLCYNRIIG